jgi:hypothetical protein
LLERDFAMADFVIPGSKVVEAQRTFYQAFGLTMASWARLESCMFYWFMNAIEKPEDVARAVFFSAKNFTGRRDMFNAAIPHSSFDNDIRAFLKAASKKARQYAEFRNRVAHGEPTIDGRRTSPSFMQYVLSEPRFPRSSALPEHALDSIVTNEHLDTATQNLTELVRLMWDMHPQYRVADARGTPQEYRQLVLRLPNKAHSKEPARISAEQKELSDDLDA